MQPSTTIHFGPLPSDSNFAPKHHVFIGAKAQLTSAVEDTASAFAGKTLPEAVVSTLAQVQDGRTKEAKTWDGYTSYAFVELQTRTSRNLGYVRSDLIHSLVKSNVPAKEDVQLTVLLSDENQILGAVNAIASAFPKYNRKSSARSSSSRTVAIDLFLSSTSLSAETYKELNILANAVRHAQLLVDTPTAELNTTALVAEVEAVASRHANVVKKTIISGEALREQGMNAIYGVGKAATAPPALCVLEYTPAGHVSEDVGTISLVGKGIVYDTGGLSLKTTTSMCDMKGDMGGAAALLNAFNAIVSMQVPLKVVYVGCVAENAIGPNAQRNDDVVIALSGKSIEINNTDAEGRLVLADGIAYTTLHHNPKWIIDMATLTGAQKISTGMHHAGIVANTKEWEDAVFAAGQASGDWCFPMLYAPELLMKEFDSKVADMKNSVRSRTNAQSSCAAHFIESHIQDKWSGEWCHVDMSGPSFRDGRATGYGTALVVEVVRSLARA